MHTVTPGLSTRLLLLYALDDADLHRKTNITIQNRPRPQESQPRSPRSHSAPGWAVGSSDHDPVPLPSLTVLLSPPSISFFLYLPYHSSS